MKKKTKFQISGRSNKEKQYRQCNYNLNKPIQTQKNKKPNETNDQ